MLSSSSILSFSFFPFLLRILNLIKYSDQQFKHMVRAFLQDKSYSWMQIKKVKQLSVKQNRRLFFLQTGFPLLAFEFIVVWSLHGPLSFLFGIRKLSWLHKLRIQVLFRSICRQWGSRTNSCTKRSNRLSRSWDDIVYSQTDSGRVAWCLDVSKRSATTFFS